MEKRRKRILVVGVNWLGDLLFMTPAIRAIRRAYPESHIACLAAPRGLDLLRGNPHLDEVIPLEEKRGAGQWLRWGPLLRRLKGGRFDTAYLFHRSLTRAILVWAVGIPCRIGYRTWKRSWLLTVRPKPLPKDSVHKAEGFLRLLEADGIRPDGQHYDAGLLPEDEEWALRLFREWGILAGDRVVALHAGANWRLKRWGAGNFARLADGLVERHGVKILLVGGDGDGSLLQGIQGRMRNPSIVAAGRTSFRGLGALLAKAALLVSNDSGPLHLGIAVGTPVIALFGPTEPALTGPPPGSRGVCLTGSIGCPVPCTRLSCPANLCMQRITVEQVLESAARILKENERTDPHR